MLTLDVYISGRVSPVFKPSATMEASLGQRSHCDIDEAATPLDLGWVEVSNSSRALRSTLSSPRRDSQLADTVSVTRHFLRVFDPRARRAVLSNCRSQRISRSGRRPTNNRAVLFTTSRWSAQASHCDPDDLHCLATSLIHKPFMTVDCASSSVFQVYP